MTIAITFGCSCPGSSTWGCTQHWPRHRADSTPQKRFSPSWTMFCVVCLSDNVQTVLSVLGAEWWTHAQIQVHHGQTHGEVVLEPTGIEELTAKARIVDPAVVSRSDACLDPSQCGLKMLGTPIGFIGFIRTELDATTTTHATLLQWIPAMRDLQSSSSANQMPLARPLMSKKFARARAVSCCTKCVEATCQMGQFARLHFQRQKKSPQQLQ